ncbi:MAG: CMP-N,N'-diacetyllegionaminic acid synthase [Crocinitomix sp.]|jgi:CMP-N,N'-diacetyllegionaminic acid synthase
MNVLGIIPARGGSKRVPQKNIKMLGGKPLIAFTIEAAQQALNLTDIIVSTDSGAIAEVAKKFGAKVPFIRPAELALDGTSDRPVLIHALEQYLANNEGKIDAICLLRPTSPFRTATSIDKGIALLKSSGSDAVRSMTKVEGVHHPYWMFQSENGLATNVVPGISIEKYYQSQLLPPVYRLNGCVDLIKVDVLLNADVPLYGNSIQILETVEQESLDIDTLEDFEYCEWLMSRK